MDRWRGINARRHLFVVWLERGCVIIGGGGGVIACERRPGTPSLDAPPKYVSVPRSKYCCCRNHTNRYQDKILLPNVMQKRDQD